MFTSETLYQLFHLHDKSEKYANLEKCSFSLKILSLPGKKILQKPFWQSC